MPFRWEPEGRYGCTKSMVLTPFWFSREHRQTELTPFWFSADALKGQIIVFMNEAYNDAEHIGLYINATVFQFGELEHNINLFLNI